MKKAMIAHFSRTGKTEQMAEYIAEGVRITRHEAELKKISDINSEKGFADYDGVVIGCPTYRRAMFGLIETFLFMGQKANLEGRVIHQWRNPTKQQCFNTWRS